MTTTFDLDRPTLSPLLGTRPLRTFPAMLSTEAEAMAWARQGAVHGSVVTAGYQAAPRGRSGLSWAERFTPTTGLGCSIVLRPDLPEAREGWLYVTATQGIHDVLQERHPEGDVTVEWPDRVLHGPDVVAAVGVQAESERGRLRWVVITVLVPDVAPPRAPLLARLVAAIEDRSARPTAEVLEAHRRASATLGRRVRASVLPMGPASPEFVGVALDVVDDGGLLIETDEGPRVVVTPQSLGFLEPPDVGPMGPASVG